MLKCEETLMGLFDWFRKPAPTIPLPQLCYDVAYFILPHYAFQDLAKLADLCLNTPSSAGLFFYLMAVRGREIEPVVADGQRFQWHHGTLGEGCDYFALEYPMPPAIDLSELDMERIMQGETGPVLAPYFSAIIRGRGSVQYFILGQAPMGGLTTLRCILPDGSNCNLGRGPTPELAGFLEAIRERTRGSA